MASTPPIGDIGVKAPTTTTTSATSKTSTDDKDMFLKLLIAQMKNQDPSNPTDPSQYLTQMAQFTQVEKLGTLADVQQSMLQSSQLTSAVAMVGSKIEYGAGSTAGAGVVTAVSVVSGVPQLLVGTTKVALADVTKVTAA
jgi:flagellar basal-body rod modification protein FlgD